MNIKIKISKKLLLRLALFIAVIGVATLFDIYFENNPLEINDIQSEAEESAGETGRVYVINQLSTISANSLVQKAPVRKFQGQAHDKLIQKYHQLRNFQVFKAEVQTQTTPLILSYHYLVFKNYFFTLPDDVPLNS